MSLTIWGCRIGTCAAGEEECMSDDVVPDFFKRLWRLPETPQSRGRKSTLDVETVVATAVQLADHGGLEAATLPKVAEALNVTAMSLYRHIGSKHELLQLMMDAASEPPGPESAAADWREGLRSWAIDLWTLYQKRPWIPRVPIYRSPSGPNQTAWLERGLSQLASTALNAKEMLSALTLLSGFVRQSALLQSELEAGRDGQAKAESERDYGTPEGRRVLFRSSVDPPRSHLPLPLGTEPDRLARTRPLAVGVHSAQREGDALRTHPAQRVRPSIGSAPERTRGRPGRAGQGRERTRLR